MSSTLRALLIASPFGELRGPANDVKSMARVLTKYGFELTECYGPEASRANILQRWRDIIDNSSDGDTVVIYYSGHGGIVDSSGDTHNQQGDPGKPLRSQFLVPMDFDQTTDGDFRGILDIEISYLLRDTTDKTKNVSIILDCCHAGRMARDPHHIRRAWPRNLPEVKHHGVLREHEQRLRREGQLTGDTSVEGNEHAVRIAAAATTESAWEYLNSQEEPVGVLTEALVAAMEKAHGQRLSWRTIMLGVCEFVNREFPQQHPRAEGPDARILFSEEQSTSGALAVAWEGDSAIIRGGRVAGVHEGNEYDIMPLGSEVVDEKKRIAVVKVEFVNGFKAEIRTTSGTVPPEGALAFLQKETLPALFVSFPSDLPALGEKLKASRFFTCNELGEGQSLVDIEKEDDRLVVRQGATVLATHLLTEATMETTIDAVVSDGERLARGHHFLALQSGEGDEKLATTIDIEFGQVEDGACLGPLTKDGTAQVKENQRIYIKLRNSGDARVFVSVFDVNVNGTIGLISGGSPRGIELASRGDHVLGKTQFGGTMKGLGLSWPKPVPKAVYVDETLVFVVSSEEVSLQHLADPKRSVEPKGSASRLERITYQLASGQARTVESDSQSRCVRYAVHHIPFTLHSQH